MPLKRDEEEDDNGPKDLVKTNVDNEFEILADIAKVRSRVNKEVTEDFTFAKLDDVDKKGIAEMTTNAFYISRLYEQLSERATKWEWNPINQEWIQRKLNKTEKKKVIDIGRNTFDALMTRPIMTVILNRNKPNNDLVEILAKRQKEPTTTETITALIEEEKARKEKTKEKGNT